MEIITSHINADFDAFSSMVAAKRLYPQAELVFPGSQEKKVRDFVDAFHPAEIKKIKEIEIDNIEKMIVVDAKSPGRIGIFGEIADKSGIKIHIYDHHPRVDGDIKAEYEVVEGVGATATIMTEVFKQRGIVPTPMEATLLCLGIYEETGNLLFVSTTDRDLQAVSYLIKHGASLKIVSSYMKSELNREELDLLNELIQTSRDVIIHGVEIRLAKASREEYVGDAAHLAHKMMDMEDIDGVVLMLGLYGKVLMVGRSRAPELDIAEVLEDFGGGGHHTAASATIDEMPLEILEEKVIVSLNRSVKPAMTANDIMTHPVITISNTGVVKDAESMMTRYGVNVLPVVLDGRYKGIITREVVEKAMFHGFRKSPVMDFASTDVKTASRHTPVKDVEVYMIERNQRFMPVLEDEIIVGAITRTDLLRLIYEESLKRDRVKSSDVTATHISHGRAIGQMLKSRFPEKIHTLLKTSGEIADTLQYNAYLVGGSVRDMLMGKENLDIDIVIEGDGIRFAEKLAETLSARVRSHQRFGTAKVIAHEISLDVATARTEYYDSPASLPTVETSSIKKDLYRRDFTINTLAVRLNQRAFGELVDFFGAQRDIREKTIRVLHNLSFVEDPTRAFRAVRFSERFGMRISRHTENLIKSAIKMNLFDRLSGARLYDELRLVFEEAEPVKTIKRLSEYELLGVIHPRLEWKEELGDVLTSVHNTLLWVKLSFLEGRPDRCRLYLMGLLTGLNEEYREDALKRLSVSPVLRQGVIKGIQDARQMARAMPFGDAVAIYDSMAALPLETVLFAMALTMKEENKKEISKYLLELRKIKPQLTGNYLKRLGIPAGPLYSRILRELQKELLKGLVKNKEDEERFVKEYIKNMKEMK